MILIVIVVVVMIITIKLLISSSSSRRRLFRVSSDFGSQLGKLEPRTQDSLPGLLPNAGASKAQGGGGVGEPNSMLRGLVQDFWAGLALHGMS